MNRYRVGALCAVAALLALGSISPAAAQTTDHFKCFKIKDPGVMKAATATLTPAQGQFVTESCTLKGKAATLCIPADKSNVVIEGGAIQSFPAGVLTGAQLCYKIKCANAAVLSLQVSDQFGTRFIAKGKATKVCGPVVEN